MLLPLLAAVSLSVLAESSDRIVLRCELADEQPGIPQPSDFYPNGMDDIDQQRFIEDIWRHGLVSVVMPPDDSWAVDYGSGTLMELSGEFPALEMTKVTSASITAEGPDWAPMRRVDLNRITGEMSVLSSVRDTGSWYDEFGVRPPSLATWYLDCAPAEQMF